MTDQNLEFLNLYNTFRPKIFRYLARVVGEHEAEDLTQDVFVKAASALNTFRGESQLSTWIYRIATNTAVDRLRSPSFKRSIQKGSPNDPFARVEIDLENKNTWTGETPLSLDAALIRKEMNDCIRNFIENLPPDYRTVIVLSELEGLKNAQIADILGVTLDAVKIRLHRARRKLKKEMEAHCSFYHDERNELGCDLKIAFDGFREDQ